MRLPEILNAPISRRAAFKAGGVLGLKPVVDGMSSLPTREGVDGLLEEGRLDAFSCELAEFQRHFPELEPVELEINTDEGELGGTLARYGNPRFVNSGQVFAARVRNPATRRYEVMAGDFRWLGCVGFGDDVICLGPYKMPYRVPLEEHGIRDVYDIAVPEDPGGLYDEPHSIPVYTLGGEDDESPVYLQKWAVNRVEWVGKPELSASVSIERAVASSGDREARIVQTPNSLSVVYFDREFTGGSGKSDIRIGHFDPETLEKTGEAELPQDVDLVRLREVGSTREGHVVMADHYGLTVVDKEGDIIDQIRDLTTGLRRDYTIDPYGNYIFVSEFKDPIGTWFRSIRLSIYRLQRDTIVRQTDEIRLPATTGSGRLTVLKKGWFAAPIYVPSSWHHRLLALHVEGSNLDVGIGFHRLYDVVPTAVSESKTPVTSGRTVQRAQIKEKGVSGTLKVVGPRKVALVGPQGEILAERDGCPDELMRQIAQGRGFEDGGFSLIERAQTTQPEIESSVFIARGGEMKEVRDMELGGKRLNPHAIHLPNVQVQRDA